MLPRFELVPPRYTPLPAIALARSAVDAARCDSGCHMGGTDGLTILMGEKRRRIDRQGACVHVFGAARYAIMTKSRMDSGCLFGGRRVRGRSGVVR